MYFWESLFIEQSISFSSGFAQVDSTIHNTKGVMTVVASLLPLCNKLIRKVQQPENMQNFLSQFWISCTLMCVCMQTGYTVIFSKCLCTWIPVKTKQCVTKETFIIFIGETDYDGQGSYFDIKNMYSIFIKYIPFLKTNSTFMQGTVK